MGLDLYHHKATLERPAKLDPFNRSYMLESEFEGFDVSFGYFDGSIQQVDVPETLSTIIFPKEESRMDYVKEFLKGGDYEFLFEETAENRIRAVERYREKYDSQVNLLHSWETSDWTGFHIYRYGKQEGFYFESPGYQRKGMNGNFWKRFESDTVWNFTGKEDFDFALSCVDYHWDNDTAEEVEMRKSTFKEHFTGNYEEGKSWLSISN